MYCTLSPFAFLTAIVVYHSRYVFMYVLYISSSLTTLSNVFYLSIIYAVYLSIIISIYLLFVRPPVQICYPTYSPAYLFLYIYALTNLSTRNLYVHTSIIQCLGITVSLNDYIVHNFWIGKNQ